MRLSSACNIRLRQLLRLAIKDLRHGWPTTLCLGVAVAAALLPLLVLFGLKFGVVSSLIEALRADPNVREIRLVRDTELTLSWFEEVAARPDVAFLLPRTNFLASSVRLRGPDGRKLLETRMLPTAQGDPLLMANPAPQQPEEIVITAKVAQDAGAAVGDKVELIIRRIVGEDPQAVRMQVAVIGVLPRDTLQTDDILVSPLLETAIETWRQGFAVPEQGWVADDGSDDKLRPLRRSFSSFRLYATDVRDVPGLRDILFAQNLDVRTRAEDVSRVLVIERALTLIFLAISTLGSVGFLLTLGLHLAASVAEKARELAVLRLLGMNSIEISLMPSAQGILISALGAGMACILALIGQPLVNRIFTGIGGIEGQVSVLTPLHIVIALGATTLAGGLAGSVAGARTASIEPSRGLRHD